MRSPLRTFLPVTVAAALVALSACSGTPTATSPAGTSADPAGSPVQSTAAGSTSLTSATMKVAGPVTSAVSRSAGREVNPAGDIPDNQAFVKYVPPAGAFSIKVPEGWARTDTSAGVLFTDKYNSLRVESFAAQKAPTIESVRSLELPAVAASASGYTAGTVTNVGRAAGPAVLGTYRADTPPNPVTGKVTSADVERYEFFHAGNKVVITVAAPVGADNVDPWRTVTDSLSWSR